MEKNGNMQNTWIEESYNETNADNRLRILNDNKDNSELDSFREKLWIARYGKRKPKKDKFVGYLMEMKYLSEGNSVDISGSKRKQLYEIINGLCLLNSDEIQLSDEGIAKKIAEQISAIAFSTPHAFNLDKEFSILQKAALVAYREKYPNREHFLTK